MGRSGLDNWLQYLDIKRTDVDPGKFHCHGESCSSFNLYEFTWIPLVSAQIVTEDESNVWLFLLLCGTFYCEIYSQVQYWACAKLFLRWGNFAVLFIQRKFTSSRGVIRCWTTGSPPLEVAPGQRKAHANSNGRQTVDRGKFNLRSLTCLNSPFVLLP